MADVKRSAPTLRPRATPVVAKPEATASLEALAAMGGGEIAYIRDFRVGELKHMFPQTADLHPTIRLYALFGADGTPLMLADSREALVSGAWQNDLEVRVLH